MTAALVRKTPLGAGGRDPRHAPESLTQNATKLAALTRVSATAPASHAASKVAAIRPMTTLEDFKDAMERGRGRVGGQSRYLPNQA